MTDEELLAYFQAQVQDYDRATQFAANLETVAELLEHDPSVAAWWYQAMLEAASDG
jgi:pterin-4a-carbinolamine dehydratase